MPAPLFSPITTCTIYLYRGSSSPINQRRPYKKLVPSTCYCLRVDTPNNLPLLRTNNRPMGDFWEWTNIKPKPPYIIPFSCVLICVAMSLVQFEVSFWSYALSCKWVFNTVCIISLTSRDLNLRRQHVRHPWYATRVKEFLKTLKRRLLNTYICWKDGRTTGAVVEVELSASTRVAMSLSELHALCCCES